MTQDIERQSRPTRDLMLRGTILNLAGVALPLLLGFFLMPVITRHLGPARFGLLGLSWAILEYFALFDAGLGRATTRAVSERLARGGDGLSQIVAVSLAGQLLLGGLGALLLGGAVPILVGHVFVIPADLAREARQSFVILALMLPTVLLAMSLRGLLEAAYRFDLSNIIRIPGSAASFVIPALLAPLGVSLPVMLAVMLAARVVTCTALAVAARSAVPGLRFEWPRGWTPLRPLLSFGGWIAISNVVSPLLIYLDRFMLASLAGVVAVGFYTAPYEAATRLLMVPASLVTAMFPTVTALGARGERARVSRLFGAALRNLLLVLVLPIVLIVALAPQLLTAWLGAAYAERSALALRILALGVFANALAHIPSSCLQALGRPDISAKCHVIELVIHLPLVYLLVSRYGITGAAAAWTTRVVIDAIALFLATWRIFGISGLRAFDGRGWQATGAVLALGATSAALATELDALPWVTTAALLAAGSGFCLYIWLRVMDGEERAMFVSLVRRRPAELDRP